jgi:(4S)-4-hydroxy-5-phosphonooxypentane-2,3-dione isomerase
MHVVIEFLDAKPHHRAGVRTALMMMSRQVLAKKIGCNHYDVGQDDLDGSAFLVYQVFENKAAYRAHQEMPEYAEHRLLVDPWIVTRRTLSYELISSAGVA